MNVVQRRIDISFICEQISISGGAIFTWRRPASEKEYQTTTWNAAGDVTPPIAKGQKKRLARYEE
jgi:hypothetical protein